MAVPSHSMTAAGLAPGVADTNVCAAAREVPAMSPNGWRSRAASPVAGRERHDHGMVRRAGLAAPEGVAGCRPGCRTAAPGATGRPAPSLVPAGHDAAVHVPDGSGHPAGLLREEERDRRGDVACRTDAAQRVKGVEAGQGLVDLVLRDESFVQRGL